MLCDGRNFGKNWCDFGVIFVLFLGKILRDFENIGWRASWIDASEISRSLSNESVNIGGVPYKLVKVHLTNWYIGIG